MVPKFPQIHMSAVVLKEKLETKIFLQNFINLISEKSTLHNDNVTWGFTHPLLPLQHDQEAEGYT